jgi:hypothetical protein
MGDRAMRLVERGAVALDQIGADYVRGIKAAMPDISLETRNWAARGDNVFVEYAMEATVNGERLAWDGIGRFKLRDGRVIDAIGRWDTAAIQTGLEAQRSTAG